MTFTTNTSNHEVTFSAFGYSDTGRQRKNNEDAFLVADLNAVGSFNPSAVEQRLGKRGALLVVADGMGGAAAGAVASALAVATLHSGLQHHAPAANDAEQLRQATERANAVIRQYAQSNPQAEGMGTTLTAALLRSGIAYLAQIGDSRAYLIRGQRIRQLAKDQSLVQQMLERGLLTPEEAARHPYRNIVMQALGVAADVDVALSTCALQRHDALLLCSDGLSNLVNDAELQRIVSEAESPAYACRLLIELANARGGTDNITVIVARFDGAGLSAKHESITESLQIN